MRCERYFVNTYRLNVITNSYYLVYVSFVITSCGVLFIKMDLVASLLTFTMFWKMSWSLYCYSCDPERRPTCDHFDYSSKYLTKCPTSTMCYKRITTLDFGDGVTSVILRGCAQQTWDGEQEKVNGKWRHKSVIHEPYEEKCEEDPTDDQRTTKTVHCYCRGDMCNRGKRLERSIIGLFSIAALLMLF